MPDTTVLEMEAVTGAPALSSTGDSILVEEAPALSATEPGQKEPVTVRERDEHGRFKPVDKAQTGDVDNATVDAQAETGEPTDGDKESGEAAGAEQKPDADKTDPATRAIISRFKAQLDAQAAEIALLKAVKPAEPAPRPRYDTFDSPEAYETALVDWAEAEGSRKAAEKAREDQVKAAQAQQAKAIADTWTQRQSAWRKEHPDYDHITGPDEFGRPLNIPVFVAVPIAQLDNGPQVEQWLGEHRDEADRIASLAPIVAAAEIGKLSATLAQQAQRPVPKPKPKPMEPVGNRSRSDVPDLDKMSTEEYQAHMQREGRLKYKVS